MSLLKDYSKTNWRPSYYAMFLPEMRQIAIDHGYTMAIHGSMSRDMDIVMVPWIEKPKPVEEMIDNLLKAAGGVMHDVHISEIGEKPHGRVVYTLAIASDRFFDVSVMPVLNGHSSTPA
mgnify:CR=1 FL=1